MAWGQTFTPGKVIPWVIKFPFMELILALKGLPSLKAAKIARSAAGKALPRHSLGETEPVLKEKLSHLELPAKRRQFFQQWENSLEKANSSGREMGGLVSRDKCTWGHCKLLARKSGPCIDVKC